MRIGLYALAVAGWLTAGGVTIQDAKAQDKKAQDKKATTAEKSKTAEFTKLYGELQDTIARLREIQDEYKVAPPDRLAALEKEFADKQAKAKALIPRIQAVAEAAIQAGATQPDVSDFLGAMALDAQRRADEEEALRLAELVLEAEQKSGDKELRRPVLYRIAGVAAFNLSQLDAAEKHLKALEKYELVDLGYSKRYLGRLEEERKYWQREQKLRQAEAKADDLPRVKLETTQGVVEVELFENEAPNTVANFIHLVESNFYDGKPFHFVSAEEARVGRPDDEESDAKSAEKDDTDSAKDDTDSASKEKQEARYTIPCECVKPNFRRHFRGSLSMVLDNGQKDTGFSEFRILYEPTRTLRDPAIDDEGNPLGGTTVFGRVVSGMDVLTRLRRVGGLQQESAEPDRIKKATVLRKRPHEYKVNKVGDEKPKPAEKEKKKGGDKDNAKNPKGADPPQAKEKQPSKTNPQG